MEKNTLEKIDIVRERTGCTYEEANQLLTQSDGNVVEAIILYEQESPKHEEIHVKADSLVEKVKELIRKGNVKRITIVQNDKVILNIPVNYGVVAAVFAPTLAILASVVALASDYVIKIEK